MVAPAMVRISAAKNKNTQPAPASLDPALIRVGPSPHSRLQPFRHSSRTPDSMVLTRDHLARTALVQPAVVFCAESQKQRMNFQEQEVVLKEPWWVTIMGCLTLAMMFAFVLIAV